MGNYQPSDVAHAACINPLELRWPVLAGPDVSIASSIRRRTEDREEDQGLTIDGCVIYFWKWPRRRGEDNADDDPRNGGER